MEKLKLQARFKVANAQSHRHRDENGYLFVDESPVLKAGILEYYGSELVDGGAPVVADVEIEPDKIYKVFIPAEELEKAADTFRLLPLVNDHQWLGKDGADARDYQEGTTGETAVFKDNAIYVPLKFTGDKIIADIESGEKEELSASYTNKLSKSDNPDYDFVATDIQGNHIALVSKGRCGSDIRVLNHTKETRTQNMKVKNSVKLVIDGKEVDLGQFFAQEQEEDAHKETPSIVDTNDEDVEPAKEETPKTDNEDKREVIREIMAVSAKDVADFEGGEDEKIREIAKLAEKLAYEPSEDTPTDNEDGVEKKDEEEKQENKACNSKKSFDDALNKAIKAMNARQEKSQADIKRAYNAAAEMLGEFNPFGMSAREMLVKALNHCGVQVDKESDTELYAMLKAVNQTGRIDNSYAYGTTAQDEVEINI